VIKSIYIYASFEVFAAVPSRIQVLSDVTLHCWVLPDDSNERVAQWPRLLWRHNQHNTTVWTASRKGSRKQPLCCLSQRLHLNRLDWHVVLQKLLSGPTNCPDTYCSSQRIRVLVQWTKFIWWNLSEMCRLFGIKEKKEPQQMSQAEILEWNTK